MNWIISTFGLILVINSSFVFSQPKLNIGLEAGLNSSGLPHRRTINHGKESYMPLISPIVGLSVAHSVTKHIYAGIGIQYYNSGERYRYHSENLSLISYAMVINDTREDITYSRVSIPVMMGYNFKIKKTRMNVSVGYKTIFHSWGSYYYKSLTTEKGKTDLMLEKGLNPFDHTLKDSAPKKIWAPTIGIGVGINKNSSIKFSFTPAIFIMHFREIQPLLENPGYYYTRSDFSLTLNYSLFNSRRSD